MKAGKKRLITLALLCNLILVVPAKSYGPLAHCLAAPTGTQWFQNLPDLWRSWDPSVSTIPLGVGIEVTRSFCWSHACQGKGVVTAQVASFILGSFTIGLLDGFVPEDPTEYGIPLGIEEPEWDMYYIWRDKLLPSHRTDLMLPTAQGFACHNVEDSVVHWGYFQGGTEWNWVVEHVLKEPWVEYIVFFGAGGTFDASGVPIPPARLNMGSTADAGIINLAQKVFRKNRQTADYEGYPSTRCTVERSAQISSRITAQNAKLAAYVQGLSFDRFSDYNFFATMLETNWTVTTALEMQFASTSLASSMIVSMP